MRPYLAEFIGTFVLVLCGCGSAVLAADPIGYAGIAMSFGFVLVAMVDTLGPISGCHLTLEHLTQQTGLSRGALLSRLARELPSAIDRYAADGRAPA